MEIEAKLESIESKIEGYNTQIENLSSLITTLIHSFQQNQLPNIKTEILSKIEEKFQDSASFPDVDEMKEVIGQLRADFSENQSGLNVKITELDNVVARLISSVENISVNEGSADNLEVKAQLDNIEGILKALSADVAAFNNAAPQQVVSGDISNEKIDAINSLITTQNIANAEFLKNIENHFETLEKSILNFSEKVSAPQVQSEASSSVIPSVPVVASADMEEIKNRFDDLNLSITSVLSAIKIIDKKYTELKSFQDVIDKLTTDVVSPILLASNDIKAFVDKSTKNFEKLNEFVAEYDQGSFRELQEKVSDVNIDVNKILTLVEEFKTNSDLSNQAIRDNMAKLENMLSEYNESLTELTQGATTDAVKESVKSLNDAFYLDLLNLFNSLSFDAEAEDIKDFLENILATVTVKTDENSEKLNSIMLQFKSLLRKVEGIERTQNSISDYLKPEETDDILYSFDDIQSDLAKMRLVLNDISKSVSSSELVDEISAKIRQTGEQIENVSKLLGSTPENDEAVADIKEKIENLDAQVYDISVRTNKLLLSNEDNTLELKNNLELFRDVFDKANPEKLYELFYELTNYFNDVNEKIMSVASIVKASHTECVTIKNAMTYVGEWLDNATNVLADIRDNTTSIMASAPVDLTSPQPATPVPQASNVTDAVLNDVKNVLQDITESFNDKIDETNKRIDNIEANMKVRREEIQKCFIILDQNMQARSNDIQQRIVNLEAKLDALLNLNAPASPAVENVTFDDDFVPAEPAEQSEIVEETPVEEVNEPEKIPAEEINETEEVFEEETVEDELQDDSDITVEDDFEEVDTSNEDIEGNSTEE